MTFRGKAIIVTGASAGIGRELAHVLAARHARLALAARNAEALEELAGECRARGGEAIAVPTDVTDPDACGRLVARTVEAFGGVDIVVNDAGISMWSRFDEVTDLSIFEALVKVNYLGAVYVTHHALAHLKRSRGLLVAISSLTGKTGVPTRSGYAASKHAMQGFFDSLRIELRHTGVGVLVVSPGFVRTDIRSRALGGDGKPLTVSPRDETRGTMSVEDCVARIVDAMAHRRRELVMTPQAKVGMYVKPLAPRLVDWVAARTIRDPGK